MFILLSLGVLLGGCAAAFVPSTSDPYEKIYWANGLIHHDARPLPAERLIRQSIEIFQERDDELGLAHAYRAYGNFFASPALNRWSKWYEKHGFLDKSAAFAARYAKGLEYLVKAQEIYSTHHRFETLTYVYYDIGLTYEKIGDKLLACKAYVKSAENYHEEIRLHPDTKFDLPDDTTDYDEHIEKSKGKVPCE